MKSGTKYLIVSILFLIAGILQLYTYYANDGNLMLGVAGWLLTVSGILYYFLGRKAGKSN